MERKSWTRVCVFCAVELSLTGEALSFRNTITLESSLKTVPCYFWSNMGSKLRKQRRCMNSWISQLFCLGGKNKARQLLLFPPSLFCGLEDLSCCWTAPPSLLLKLGIFYWLNCFSFTRTMEIFCQLQKSAQLLHSLVSLGKPTVPLSGSSWSIAALSALQFLNMQP